MGLVLKKVLVKIVGEFDVVIIDCFLVFGVLMVNVFVVCDKVIVFI